MDELHYCGQSSTNTYFFQERQRQDSRELETTVCSESPEDRTTACGDSRSEGKGDHPSGQDPTLLLSVLMVSEFPTHSLDCSGRAGKLCFLPDPLALARVRHTHHRTLLMFCAHYLLKILQNNEVKESALCCYRLNCVPKRWWNVLKCLTNKIYF